MSRLEVTTWNVLHRIHAVNWSEAPLAAYPDEHTRIAAIAAAVAERLASSSVAVLLQEVSGDQLASLRSTVAAGVTVFDHEYPRVPKLRSDDCAELDDPTEHLVTLVTTPHARVVAKQTFASDPGKGFLAVDLGDGTVVLNTHVSWGSRREEQLALVSTTARAYSGPVVLGGDFNAEVETVARALGEGFVLVDLSGQRHSRCATSDRGGYTIDHVAVLRGAIASGAVLDGNGLSDHNPVTAQVVLGT